MEAMIIGLLAVVLLGVFLTPEQQPPSQPPMVIYLGQEPAQSGNGWGCAPTLLILALLAVLLSVQA